MCRTSRKTLLVRRWYLFSGRTQITSSSNNFIIPVGSSTAVNYVVSDSLGNPLVSGTSIQVAASGPGSSDVTMTGDVTVNIPDTQDKRYTQFQVSLKDIRTTGLNLSQATHSDNQCYQSKRNQQIDPDRQPLRNGRHYGR